MTKTRRLPTMLNDPETRPLIFGLAHSSLAAQVVPPGASRLRAVVLHLAATATPEQHRDWLSDHWPNRAMTTDQVRATIGDDSINDLAQWAGAGAVTVAWQLTTVLPDLVDAVTPGGEVMSADLLAAGIEQAWVRGPHPRDRRSAVVVTGQLCSVPPDQPSLIRTPRAHPLLSPSGPEGA